MLLMTRENGIQLEDIYNFDETAFAMVVTRAEYYGRRAILKTRNREWITTIESVNTAGWALPPCMIFKGKNYIEGWFDGLLRDWRIKVSPNGWTTDEISLRWLRKQFIPATARRTRGKYRLSILDDHSSHLTAQFDRIGTENAVIPLYMPAHSSHPLQLLGVGFCRRIKTCLWPALRRIKYVLAIIISISSIF